MKNTGSSLAKDHARLESIPAGGESRYESVKTFSLDKYKEEEIVDFIGMIVDAEHLLHYIKVGERRISFSACCDPVTKYTRIG